MKKTVPVLGTINDKGEAREFPAVKVIGGMGDFIECPACLQMLDKRDLVGLIEHEGECEGGPAEKPQP